MPYTYSPPDPNRPGYDLLGRVRAHVPPVCRICDADYVKRNDSYNGPHWSHKCQPTDKGDN